MSSLPAGFVLRRGRPEDAEALADFNADVLRPQDAAEPQAGMRAWTRDLMTGRHPWFRPGDALIIEDAGGRIASAALLVDQTLSVEGVLVPTGQPELVGTRAEYRGRGLVRALFGELHAESARRGHLVQFIAGIPWFYRQFGYEMAIARGGGPWTLRSLLPAVPAVPEYHLRPMVAADAPFAAALDDHARARYLVSVPRDAELWRREMDGRSPDSALRLDYHAVEARDGRPVGVVGLLRHIDGTAAIVGAVEVVAGVSWRMVWDCIARPLAELADAHAARTGAARPTVISFWWLGQEHPLYRVMGGLTWRRPGAIYVRVPDVTALVRRLVPVLERRLAGSPLIAHSGELKLSFYRGGVRLVLDAGAVTTVEAWTPPLDLLGQELGAPTTDPRRADALLPDLTFLHLVFGSRTLAELEAAFPDAIVRTGAARALLEALFPKGPSDIWPVL